jgi:zinc D-Ala-D-Ala carboxypeptidase
MTAWTAKYFKPEEFACKCRLCGGLFEMNLDTVARLDRLRERVKRPLSIHSGYRCIRHPSEAGKTTVGAHRQGRAVDITCDGPTAFLIVSTALEIGFTGIGIAQKKGASRFVHLDDAPNAEGQPRPTVWSY